MQVHQKFCGKTAEQNMSNVPPNQLRIVESFTNVGLNVFGFWNKSPRLTWEKQQTVTGGLYSSHAYVGAMQMELWTFVLEAMDMFSFINTLKPV